MELLKLALFVFSSFGWWEYLRRKTGIDTLFLPVLTIALQSVCLLAAGILNLLNEVSICLYVAGLFLSANCLFRAFRSEKPGKTFSEYHPAGFVFLLVSLLVMYHYVYGKELLHYDNFSHWGIVVKLMLRENRLPNFKDEFIQFQSYPLGSSVYIYYFSRFVGRQREHIWMLAQVFMICASILPMFIFGKNSPVLSLAVITVFTNLAFCYNILVTDLLVDSLLALAAASSFVFLFYNREGKHLLFTAFNMVWLVQIKNAGVFFAVLLTVWLMIRWRKNLKNRELVISLVVPYLSILLWKRHYQSVFASAQATKHVMSLSNYFIQLQQKTAEEIGSVCRSLLRFSLSCEEAWHMMLYIVVLGVFVFLFRRDLGKKWIQFLLAAIGIYVAYQVGLLGMYLFSMPAKEALRLAGSERYAGTVLLFLCYFTTCGFLSLSGQTGKHLAYRFLPAFAAACMIFCLLNGNRLVFQTYGSSAVRDWYETRKEEYDIPEGRSYCNIIYDDDYGYSTYFLKYLFLSNEVRTYSAGGVDRGILDHVSQRYEYCLITAEAAKDETVAQWITEEFPDQAENNVICCF